MIVTTTRSGSWIILVLLALSFLPVSSGLFGWFRRWIEKRRKFQIELAYNDIPESDQNTYFVPAGKKWESVIRKDIPRLFINEESEGDCGTLPLFVDDLYVCFKYQPFDGPLKVIGSASIDVVRDGGRRGKKGDLPAVGTVVLDIADIEWLKEQGTLEKLITHETGHLLGIGTRWEYKKLIDLGQDDCPYKMDSVASRMYRKISGCRDASIPVETDLRRSGSRCKHWAEFCFLGEIMTGKLSNTTPEALKLSRMTIGSLEDLGYQVYYGNADDYTAEDMNTTCICNEKARHLEEIEGHEEEVSSRGRRDSRGTTRRRLSKAGRLEAEEYGRRLLEIREKERIKTRDISSTALYVGDKSVHVFYAENNEVFTVEVNR